MGHGKITAPALPNNLEWFNTDKPLSLEQERGKFVLLDFWTYCCINCMHVLPDLSYLEQKYPDTLTVIGIHSPKFSNERVGQQVQKAINRYHIRHPVANDPGLKTWREYAVRAWPTLVLIDPTGYIAAVLPGEGNRAALDELIATGITNAKRAGTLRPRQFQLARQPEQSENGFLFPSKLLIQKDKFYVSDSGKHRVLELDYQGKLLRQFGNGTPGHGDGEASTAAFSNPQGLALYQNELLVADTDNHLLRAINLANGTVSTLAGTGEQGGFMPLVGNFPAATTPLNSPWDLAVADTQVFIAMAGSHQIWQYDFPQQTLSLLAGSGHEDIVDGNLKAAALAQPSGLSLADQFLYVTDSETSSLRKIDLPQKIIRTLIGRGLFDFGDIDGPAMAARLQHPLGVCAAPDQKSIWIADSYNNKIKQLDLLTNVISEVKIQANLNEPGAIVATATELWIANTNNHQILRVSLQDFSVKNIKLIK